MKKFRLSACLVALLVFIVINSCKKDEQLPANTINTPTLNVASRLAASSQMQPQDLLAWYASSPFASKMNPKWGKALKTTVNGNEVIKVPLSRDAALFFTKTNGVLNVSVYKWLDKQKGAKTFTGNVVWFSFTDDVIHGAIFDKGILIKSAILNPPITMPIAGGLQGQSLSVSKFAPKVLVAAAPDLIGAALCWLTGGTWTGFKTNWCDYTNSIWASISDFLDGLFGGGVTSGGGDGGDGGDGESSADGSASGSYTGSDGSTVTVGTTTGTNGGGGGMAYVTVNPPCNVNSGSGQSFALAINHATAYKADQDPSDGGDGDGNVPCPDPTTVWVPIPIIQSPNYQITNNLDQCRSAILITLENQGTLNPNNATGMVNSIGVILQQMANNINVNDDLVNFEVNYKMVPTLYDSTKPNVIKSGTTANEYYQSGPNIYSVDVELAQDIMNKATDIFAAEILIHESIHAYMSSLLDRLLYKGMTAAQVQQLNYPTVFDDYVNILVTDNQTQLRAIGNNPQYDHQYMANTLLNTIATALSAYDLAANGSTKGNEFYWSLAWAGLEQSSTWMTFQQQPANSDTDLQGMTYALTAARMTNIKNIIQTERSGQSFNGVAVNGKVPNTTNCYQ